MSPRPVLATACSAGQYDCWLGRGDHTAADRAAADAVTDLFPTMVLAARANRRFTLDATDVIVSHGVEQIIDIGTGIPATPDITAVATHHAAHRRNHHTKVVYVDNNPAALALAHRRLTARPGHGNVTILDSDLLRPDLLLARAEHEGHLSLRRPVGVLLTAVLHDLPDSDHPHQHVAALMNTLPAGSWLAVSHLSGELLPPRLRQQIPAASTAAGVPLYPRSLAEITALFSGLTVTDPGIIAINHWRLRSYERHPYQDLPDTAIGMYAGLARKPAHQQQ